MILSKFSRPLISLYGAGSSLAVTPLSFLSAILTSVSLTRVDLPEPETPVTTIKQPTGKDTVISLRLFPLHPESTTCLVLSGLMRFLGIGINHTDHKEVLANFFTLVIIPLFHNLEDCTAIHTKNQDIATHATQTISLANHTLYHVKFILISHNTSNLSVNKVSSKFILSIILTSTVDILTAKHITTGEKMIQIRDFKFKYHKIPHSFPLSSKNPKTDNNTIIGDNTIAIQIIATLIIRTKTAAAKGIAIATA